MRAALVAGVLALAAIAGWWFWPRPELAPAAGAPGVPVEVPSGQEVYYTDTVQNVPGEGLVYRFRFVAPGISKEGGAVSEEATHDDMQFLCDSFAIPRIPATGPQPSQIVISLSDRPVQFGEAVPEATQFFEGYRIEAGRCVWELY